MDARDTPPAVSRRPFDPADLVHPIEFLRHDHDRQRAFCARLAALIDDMLQPGHRETAASLLQYLRVDVSLNIEDEEQLLAPLLGRRCLPADWAGETIAVVHRRHEEAADAAARTADGLDCLSAGCLPLPALDFVWAALQLVETLTKNLEWEDNVLLPLAALRLTAADKVSLAGAMARRRGVALPASRQ